MRLRIPPGKLFSFCLTINLGSKESKTKPFNLYVYISPREIIIKKGILTKLPSYCTGVNCVSYLQYWYCSVKGKRERCVCQSSANTQLVRETGRAPCVSSPIHQLRKEYPESKAFIHLGLALLTLSWDKNWDSHSLVNGYPSFYPRIALVAPSQRRHTTRAREVSKVCDYVSEFANRSKISQGDRQQRRRAACQISKRYVQYSIHSHGFFDTSRDLAVRRLVFKWT